LDYIIYRLYYGDVMVKQIDEPLTIIIGGDDDKDLTDLLSGKRLDQPKNILYLDTFEELDDLLSPKRLELLRYLMKNQKGEMPKSISILAKETKRFQEAISKDIKHLAKLGLVEIKKEKQSVYAYPKYKAITIKTK
jgi:predicted transcriptional regulator